MGRLRSISTNDQLMFEGCSKQVNILERRDSNGLRRRFQKIAPPHSELMREEPQSSETRNSIAFYSFKYLLKVLFLLGLCALFTVVVVVLWLHQFYPKKFASYGYDESVALVRRQDYNRPILLVQRSAYHYGDNDQIARFADPFDHGHGLDLLASESEQTEDAIMERILETSADSEVLATVGRAVEYRKSGKLHKAQRLLEHALALAPQNPDVLTEFGLFLESAGEDVVAADNMFSRALAYNPEHSTALINRARTSPLVENMDQRMLTELDRKRHYFLSIPRSSPALRQAMRDAYFAHVYHTVALEGNSMDLGQTRSILETRLAIAGKSVLEHNEILGMDLALRYLNSTLVDKIGRITLDNILQLHRRVLGHVDPVQAGYWRRNQVYVGKFTPPPADALREEMDAFVQWINEESTLSIHPVELAAIAHYKLVYIHPFIDGNGRVSRLIMNAILMHSGFPPVILPVEDRLRYYECLKIANDGDLRPFIRFVARATDKTLQGYIDAAVSVTSVLPRGVDGLVEQTGSEQQFNARHPRTVGVERSAATQPASKSDSAHRSTSNQVSSSVLERIIQDQSRVQKPTTTAQKVKRGATDLTYVMLALAGLACLGGFVYLLWTEMFTGMSPQRVFGRSLELVRNDDTCRDLFGTPIKGFGEETRRGRRRQPTYLQYEKDGEMRMRMMFYLKGPLAQGAAHLEMRTVGF